MQTISIGLSSQWNFGKKRQRWQASVITISSIETWLTKSSCWLSSLSMKQLVLSNGQTGAHFVLSPEILNPRSSRTVFSPFCRPKSVVIFCTSPCLVTSGLDWGIMVSCCLCCFPPFDLFISKALSASRESEAWAEELSKMKRAWYSGLVSSWISMAALIWSRRFSSVHHGSPLTPG